MRETACAQIHKSKISPFRKERHIGASPLSWIRNKPVATPPCASIRKPHRHPYHINTFPDLATQLSPSILVLSLETTTQVMTPDPICSDVSNDFQTLMLVPSHRTY